MIRLVFNNHEVVGWPRVFVHGEQIPKLCSIVILPSRTCAVRYFERPERIVNGVPATVVVEGSYIAEVEKGN